MAEPSDQDLFERTRRGERRAFDQLHKRYQKVVFGIAMKRVRNFHRAEDAAQETWLDLMKRTSAPPNMEAWLVDVAKNKTIDQIRRSTKHARANTDIDDILEVKGLDASSIEEVVDTLRIWELSEQVCTEAEIDALILRYREKETLQEIADTMGIKDTNAADRLLKKATVKLQRAILS